MNYAILLCGGTGTRLGANIPKQYLMVNGQTVLSYPLQTLQQHPLVDRIVIVANEEWYDLITEEMNRFKIDKFFCFAKAGESREHSMLNGAYAIVSKTGVASNEDKILTHDAARPNISNEIIENAFQLDEHEATFPVISVADTTYLSEDGMSISQLLNRDHLFAGQTPETFCLNDFIRMHDGMSDEEICSIRGACQLAFSKGYRVKMFEGETNNYKITTIQDYERFRIQKETEIKG